MGGARTTEKWTPAGQRFLATVAALKSKPGVKVGVLGKDFSKAKDERTKNSVKPDPNISLGQVAVENEFGTDTTPERSFIRSTVDEQNKAWQRYAEKLKDKILDGMAMDRALGIMGLLIQRDIQRKIRSNIQPANAPSTIARKGSSRTLIDTGQLANSIAWELFRAGE